MAESESIETPRSAWLLSEQHLSPFRLWEGRNAEKAMKIPVFFAHAGTASFRFFFRKFVVSGATFRAEFR
jgi:hypothetical protein